MLAATACARVVGARAVAADAPELTTFHEIAVAGGRRTFLLHRPAFSRAHPLPIFIALHGSSANANVVMDESGLNAVADSIGALAVYPNGTGGLPYLRLFWNYLDCCGVGHSLPDEAAMIGALVDTLSHHFLIDRSRIGVIGFSDGGTLAYSLACSAASTITAIGVIAGDGPERPCATMPPVSAIVFHGTSDTNIRYGNTRQRVAGWARSAHCADPQTDSTAAIVHDLYAPCAAGVAVSLYSIVGGQHAWPGGRASWRFAPPPSRAIDASRVFAAFVVDHERRTAQ